MTSAELGFKLLTIRNYLPKKTEKILVQDVNSTTTPPGKIVLWVWVIDRFLVVTCEMILATWK